MIIPKIIDNIIDNIIVFSKLIVNKSNLMLKALLIIVCVTKPINNPISMFNIMLKNSLGTRFTKANKTACFFLNNISKTIEATENDITIMNMLQKLNLRMLNKIMLKIEPIITSDLTYFKFISYLDE